MLDPTQLRGFLAVADELHFARAAQRLHMAQPPLSRLIQRLEATLGVELFERSTRSVRLTAAGHALRLPAQQALEGLLEVERQAAAIGRGDIGHVRVAFAGASTNRLVAQLARTVRADHPDLVLTLDSQTFAHPGIQMLLNGDVDLVLGRWDELPATVRHDLLQRDSLMLAVADTHPLADVQAVRAHDLLGQRFVSLPDHPGAALPNRLRSLLSREGASPEIVQVAPDTETALALVSADVGVTLTLRSVAAAINDPHLRFLPVLEPTAPVDLRIAWRAADKDPAVTLVRGLALRLGDTQAADRRSP